MERRIHVVDPGTLLLSSNHSFPLLVSPVSFYLFNSLLYRTIFILQPANKQQRSRLLYFVSIEQHAGRAEQQNSAEREDRLNKEL